MSAKYKKNRTGRNRGRDEVRDTITDLCKSVNQDWKNLGRNLGFSHEQMNHVEAIFPTDQECIAHLLRKWTDAVVNHTLNYVPLIFTALKNANREDLAHEVLKQTRTHLPDNDTLQGFEWDDFIRDIRAVKFELNTSTPPGISIEEDAKKRKKKNRDRQIFYHFEQCENVIIGDGGRIKVTSAAQEGLTNPNIRDDSKEAIILNILKTLLYPSHQVSKKMKIQKLESSFNKLVRDKRERALTFFILTKTSLLNFIKNHVDVHFTLQKEKGQWYVMLCDKSCEWQQSFAKLFQTEGKCRKSVTDDSDSDEDTRLSNLQESEKLCPDDFMDNDLNETCIEEEDEGWIQVTNERKQSVRKMVHQSSESKRRLTESRRVPGSPPTCKIVKSYASAVSSNLGGVSHSQNVVENIPCIKPVTDVSGNNSTRASNTMKEQEATTAGLSKQGDLGAKKEQETVPKFSNDVDDFMKYTRKFRTGHFVLVTGEQSLFDGIETLALIPWLCVFDFDIYSRKKGLLSSLEHYLNEIRGVYVCSWKDTPRISDHVTQWCLLRGNCQEADSKTPESFKEWFRHILQGLESHLRALSRFVESYTVMKIVVLWPSETDQSNVQYIHRLLSKMEEYIDPPPKVIVVHSPSQVLGGESLFDMLNPELTLSCDIQSVCFTLKELKRNRKHRPVKYQLPTADESNDPQISESTASSFREDLEILYLNSPYRKTDSEIDDFEDEAAHFLRGGTLHWRIFYECGADFFIAERDIMDDIKSKIVENFVRTFRSGVVTIYHAPGAGGTTMAQRILWELRKETPCAHLKMKFGSSISDLAHQIEDLFERTRLPLVLLVDGEDQQRVKHLSKQLDDIAIIILRVKRYPYAINEKSVKENDFWLKGEVSPQEANKLYIRFSQHCDSDKKKRELKNIVDEVKAKTATHRVYEFGLATFVHEYKGLDSYVRGYLDINEVNQKTNGLQSFQKIAGYLALAFYYGQTSVPCQFFIHHLGKPADFDVTMGDFPHQVRELAVSCSHDGKKNALRIGHYEVAKVILEQLLTWKIPTNKWTNRTDLSPCAKSNLYSFVIKFIDEAKLRKSKKCGNTGNISGILARTFIYRDNKDVGEGENSKRKPLLSKLLADIDQKPPYTHTVQVMEKLAKSFPENPNFHAHLGRIYAICKPGEEEKAEECFRKAISLCHGNNDTTVVDEGECLALTRIYHMYGMFYLRRISRFTGRSLGDKPEQPTKKTEFEKRVKVILKLLKQGANCLNEVDSMHLCLQRRVMATPVRSL